MWNFNRIFLHIKSCINDETIIYLPNIHTKEKILHKQLNIIDQYNVYQRIKFLVNDSHIMTLGENHHSHDLFRKE